MTLELCLIENETYAQRAEGRQPKRLCCIMLACPGVHRKQDAGFTTGRVSTNNERKGVCKCEC